MAAVEGGEATGDASRPVYFFLHVPRTAGQTIRLHLAQHSPPGTFLHVGRPGLGDIVAGRRYSRAGLSDPSRLRALAGHYLARSLERYFPGREARRVLLLRDPVELQLSLYNFRMMSDLARGLGAYDFALHLEATPPDFISHFLLSRWLELRWPALMAIPGERKFVLLNKTLSRFWFVGGHDQCDRVIAAVANDLRVPAAATAQNTAERWRAQVPWTPLSMEALSPRLRARLEQRTRLDRALWETWRDAGFDPSRVRPVPFDRVWVRGHRVGEAGRLIAATRVRLARDFVRWSAVGQARRVARADAAREARDWPRAAALYRKALAAHPTSALWHQYGHAAQRGGDLATAERALREALRLKPDNRDALYQLGGVLARLGRKEEAAQSYFAVLGLDPNLLRVRQRLIKLGWSERKIDRALARNATAKPAQS